MSTGTEASTLIFDNLEIQDASKAGWLTILNSLTLSHSCIDCWGPMWYTKGAVFISNWKKTWNEETNDYTILIKLMLSWKSMKPKKISEESRCSFSHLLAIFARAAIAGLKNSNRKKWLTHRDHTEISVMQQWKQLRNSAEQVWYISQIYVNLEVLIHLLLVEF